MSIQNLVSNSPYENWIEILSESPLPTTVVQRSPQQQPTAPTSPQSSRTIHDGRTYYIIRCRASSLSVRSEDGSVFFTFPTPGRYILDEITVQQLCQHTHDNKNNGQPQIHDMHDKRVGGADVEACLREMSSQCKFVEILYEGDHEWNKCSIVAKVDEDEWEQSPGKKMQSYGTEPGLWHIRVKAQKIQFVFTDGMHEWDNNNQANYCINMPGKYALQRYGSMKYIGFADMDVAFYK